MYVSVQERGESLFVWWSFMSWQHLTSYHDEWKLECVMGGLCCFCGTGCRTAAMAAWLLSLVVRWVAKLCLIVVGQAWWRGDVCLLLFTSYQHLRSHQDWYRLVTVLPHGDFIVLSHWDTRPPTLWPYPITEPTSPCHVLIMLSARLRCDKYQF